MSNKTKAIGALLLSSLFWSAAGVVTKLLYKSFDPFPLAFIRFSIAFIVMLPIFLSQKLGNIIKIVKDFFPIALFSSGNILFYYLGLTRTTVIASTLIYLVIPFIVAIIARIFIKEKLTSNRLVGILIAFSGVVLISVLPLLNNGRTESSDWLGNLLVFIAAINWSAYTVGLKHFLNKNTYSPITLSTISFFSSTIIFGLYTLFVPHRLIIPAIRDLSNMLLIIYLSVFMTVFVFLLYQWAIIFSSAIVASINTYVQPVFGIILAMVILGEKLTAEYIMGSVLIITGLLITSNLKIWKLRIG